MLHSQPVAVNYGARTGFTAANPDLRLLFGSADGLLHSVKNSDLSETWAFMPRTTMANLTTLRNDRYVPAFPYGVDGTPSVLIIDRGTSLTLPEGGTAKRLAEIITATVPGLTASAQTSAMLAASADGRVSFQLAGQNTTPLTVTGDVAGGRLDALALAVNALTGSTGIGITSASGFGYIAFGKAVRQGEVLISIRGT